MPGMKWQCRSEPPFEAEPIVSKLRHMRAENGWAVPNRHINCPHCGRGYYEKQDGTFYADRPLKRIS